VFLYCDHPVHTDFLITLCIYDLSCYLREDAARLHNKDELVNVDRKQNYIKWTNNLPFFLGLCILTRQNSGLLLAFLLDIIP
jgi:hypothetical protein